MKIDEKRYIWLVRLYNSEYCYSKWKEFIGKLKSGLQADFERILGYNTQNKQVRIFLKELIQEQILIPYDKKLINNNPFTTYVIDKKKIYEIISETNFYKENLRLIEDNHTLLD